jgi:hypothetical protein
MKAGLPNRHSAPSNPVNFMRAPAFDQLYASLQRRGIRRSNQDMQMIRHHYKFVQQIVSFVSIFQHFIDQNPGFMHLKNVRGLKGFRRHKVRPASRRSMCQSAHNSIPQGLKPIYSPLNVGAEAPTPRQTQIKSSDLS